MVQTVYVHFRGFTGSCMEWGNAHGFLDLDSYPSSSYKRNIWPSLALRRDSWLQVAGQWGGDKSWRTKADCDLLKWKLRGHRKDWRKNLTRSHSRWEIQGSDSRVEWFPLILILRPSKDSLLNSILQKQFTILNISPAARYSCSCLVHQSLRYYCMSNTSPWRPTTRGSTTPAFPIRKM